MKYVLPEFTKNVFPFDTYNGRLIGIIDPLRSLIKAVDYHYGCVAVMERGDGCNPDVCVCTSGLFCVELRLASDR